MRATLFGKYNWWLPNWVATILRVEPSPLKPDRTLLEEFDADDTNEPNQRSAAGQELDRAPGGLAQ